MTQKLEKEDFEKKKIGVLTSNKVYLLFFVAKVKKITSTHLLFYDKKGVEKGFHLDSIKEIY